MRRALVAALPVFLLVACGAPGPLATRPTTDSDIAIRGDLTPPWLTLGSLEVRRNDKRWLLLWPDGTLAVDGEILGTIGSRGEFVRKSGPDIALRPDGEVLVAGAPSGVVIAADGVATLDAAAGTQALGIDSAGRFIGAASHLEVVGLTSDLRRTAMFAVLLPDLVWMSTPRIIE
jgi:hypothetical protein